MVNTDSNRDRQDEPPVGHDANGAEIWHNDHTIKYEGKEVVWDTFRDEILRLLKDKSGVLSLARELDLEVTRYD